VQLLAGPAIVREWRSEDAPGVIQQANDRRVWLGLRDQFPHPYTLPDAESYIAGVRRMIPPTHFAIEVSGAIAGGIGYVLREDVERIGAEVGYWLGFEYWGRGIATAAVKAVTRHAFAAHAELRRLYAIPFSSNPASARVLTKAGYRLEGTLRQSALKDGQVLDQLMYAILRDEVDQGGRHPR